MSTTRIIFLLGELGGGGVCTMKLHTITLSRPNHTPPHLLTFVCVIYYFGNSYWKKLRAEDVKKRMFFFAGEDVCTVG